MKSLLSISQTYARGSHGFEVGLVQEWLSIHLGYPYPMNLNDASPVCPITTQFDADTERCVRAFQKSRGVLTDGQVTPELFALLAQPMRDAVLTPLPRGSLSETICAVANTHLKHQPREVGGQNMGPWVRLYCAGKETLWCAGFVSYIIEQAMELMRSSYPFRRSLLCDDLARDARAAGTFIEVRRDGSMSRPPIPGDLFLVRAEQPSVPHRDYRHVGIVTDVDGVTFLTVEGNTNEKGSSNGYGVFARRRSFYNVDFITLRS